MPPCCTTKRELKIKRKNPGSALQNSSRVEKCLEQFWPFFSFSVYKGAIPLCTWTTPKQSKAQEHFIYDTFRKCSCLLPGRTFCFLKLSYPLDTNHKILLNICYMRQWPCSRAEDEPLFQVPQGITSNIRSHPLKVASILRPHKAHPQDHYQNQTCSWL